MPARTTRPHRRRAGRPAAARGPPTAARDGRHHRSHRHHPRHPEPQHVGVQLDVPRPRRVEGRGGGVAGCVSRLLLGGVGDRVGRREGVGGDRRGGVARPRHEVGGIGLGDGERLAHVGQRHALAGDREPRQHHEGGEEGDQSPQPDDGAQPDGRSQPRPGPAAPLVPVDASTGRAGGGGPCPVAPVTVPARRGSPAGRLPVVERHRAGARCHRAGRPTVRGPTCGSAASGPARRGPGPGRRSATARAPGSTPAVLRAAGCAAAGRTGGWGALAGSPEHARSLVFEPVAFEPVVGERRGSRPGPGVRSLIDPPTAP